MNWSWENTSYIKSYAKACTKFGGPSLCGPKMHSYALSWQNGSCKNCTPKVTSGEQMICGLGQLPITLMNMIAHGHGNERYAQYSNELWPNDPNFTIGSLLWLLWTLEKTLACESKMLFEHSP
jgi:hypothetical protein